jgi:hypothetical protein
MIRSKSAASRALERRKSITLATAVLELFALGCRRGNAQSGLKRGTFLVEPERNEAFNHPIWIRAQAIEKSGCKRHRLILRVGPP